MRRQWYSVIASNYSLKAMVTSVVCIVLKLSLLWSPVHTRLKCRTTSFITIAENTEANCVAGMLCISSVRRHSHIYVNDYFFYLVMSIFVSYLTEIQMWRQSPSQCRTGWKMASILLKNALHKNGQRKCTQHEILVAATKLATRHAMWYCVDGLCVIWI